MKGHPRFIALCLLTAAVAGCGRSRPAVDLEQAEGSARQPDRVTVAAGFDPIDRRIVDLVAWLKHKGVTLELTGGAEDHTGWRVTQPRPSEEYDVVFSIRSFPPQASEEQMRKALDVNLAYLLNARARLAMSHGGLTGRHPEAKLPKSDDELPKVNGLAVTTAAQRWFKEYEPR
jgi:hypothetical protein